MLCLDISTSKFNTVLYYFGCSRNETVSQNLTGLLVQVLDM